MFTKLNEEQLDKLSDIFSDLGLVGVAAVVLPAIFDKLNLLTAAFGVLATIVLWYMSLWIRR
ncbi:MAG: hypothetical protein AAB675_02875 [Patescibacteria group bacterium]